MSDVAEILGLDVRSVPTASQPPLPGSASTKKRKASDAPPESGQAKKKARAGGLAREVRFLIEGQAPLLPEPKRLVVKEKRKLERRVRKWSSRRVPLFGRSDGLSALQWSPLTATPTHATAADSVTATPSEVPVLRWANDLEYATLPLTARWTRALTARLLSLAQRYDLRWPVVFDRWATGEKGNEGDVEEVDMEVEVPAFTVEDLKERYYLVQRFLLTARGASSSASASASASVPVSLPAPYAKALDERRKAQLSLLASSDTSVHLTSLERHVSLRRAQAKHRRDAQRVCKVANTLVTSTSDQTHGLGGKARGARGGRDGAGKLRQPPKTILDEKSGVQAVKHAAAVSAALSELGVRKPSASGKSMTFKVAEKYNSLRDCLAVLCELQRLEAEALYDVAVLKAHKTALRSALESVPGSHAADVPSAVEMDVAQQHQHQQEQLHQENAMDVEEPMVLQEELIEEDFDDEGDGEDDNEAEDDQEDEEDQDEDQDEDD